MSLAIAPFVDALNETFLEMLGERPNNGPLQSSVGWRVRADISVCLALSVYVAETDEDVYSVVMTANERTALRAIETILGTKAKLDDPIVSDTVAELLNIIVGTAQSRSPQRFSFTLPVVKTGIQHEVTVLNDAVATGVISRAFDNDLGIFLVDGN